MDNKTRNSRWNWLPKVRTAGLAALVILLGALITGVVFFCLAPFGARIDYRLQVNVGPERIGVPSQLMEVLEFIPDEQAGFRALSAFAMKTDEVRFSLPVPYSQLRGMTATVRFRGDPEELLLGLMDHSRGRNVMVPLNNRSLNRMSWPVISDGELTVYQKEEVFADTAAFTGSLLDLVGVDDKGKKKATVATYHYEPVQVASPEIDMRKVNSETRIRNAIRGPMAFYVYVTDRPLEFEVEIQSLNTYAMPDTVEVLVLSADKPVAAQYLRSIGDGSGSNIPSPPLRETFRFKDLPEGVYRVNFNTTDNVITRSMRFRQNYVIFADRVFLADHDLYGIVPTREATLYTDAREVKLETWHQEALQVVTINDDEEVNVNLVGQPFMVELTDMLNEINVEKGSLLLTAVGGYFSFSEESMFDPFPVKTIGYNSRYFFPESVQFIATTYSNPVEEGESRVKQVTLDLAFVPVVNNRLELALYAPGLSASGREILIESFDVQVTR